MKKLVIVCASPRAKGLSRALAEQASDQAKADGLLVDCIDMGKMANVKPCRACDACMSSAEASCVLQDDLSAALLSAREADGILLLGPVYWFSFSSQMKLFMDRAFYSMCDFSGGHLMRGKKLAMVLVYGDENPFVAGAVNALRSFQDMAAFMGARVGGLVYGKAVMPADAEANRELFASTKSLVSGMAVDL